MKKTFLVLLALICSFSLFASGAGEDVQAKMMDIHSQQTPTGLLLNMLMRTVT